MSQPDSWVPNSVPLRAMVVTIDEPSTCAAQPVRDRAQAIAKVKKSKWFDDRKRATSTRRGPAPAISDGSSCLISKFVAA